TNLNADNWFAKHCPPYIYYFCLNKHYPPYIFCWSGGQCIIPIEKLTIPLLSTAHPTSFAYSLLPVP
ncbi:hypothetical protein, partial [Moorena sp. SIO2C4]|uniref:hypothetical protein n=1 Tax=Moorena sp. SIO2C4 TaxID=2607824 RepID=UPI002580C41B